MKLEKSWHAQLKDEIALPYVGELKRFLQQERASGHPIYPPEDLVFHAFLRAPFEKVNVVIIGQDPYHGPGQAHGLCFSVPPGVEQPPSLKNIFIELSEDLNVPIPESGCLLKWAEQGVLLLNATLTVREGEARSHYGRGWERFTDRVIEKLSERADPIVFVLWGKSAQEKGKAIKPHHAVLQAPHPSPLSAYQGFFGCKHFSKINALLRSWGKKEIEWTL